MPYVDDAAERAYRKARRLEVLATGVCWPHRRPLVEGKRSKCERCIRNYKAWSVKTNYGISLAEYEALLEKQGGGCAVCGSGPGLHLKGKSWQRGLAIDHCHATGRVRGILCGNCNNALGHAKDSVQRLHALAEYLEPTPEWIGGGC